MASEVKLICATTVPFTSNGELDRQGLPVLFGAIRESGIRYVFTPGTTGEFTGLSDDERIDVIEAAIEVFGPDGVYAHVGAATARQAAALAGRARAAGATRLAAITPYFVKAGPRSVEEYYRALVAAAPGAEIYVYIFRARASTDVTPAELATLSRIPGIAGAKISGLTTEEAIEYVRHVPEDFPVFSGNDREFLPFVRAGGAGGVSGVSNVFPQPFVLAAEALLRGEDPAALQSDIDSAVDLTGGGDFAMLKLGVAERGLPSGPLRVATEPPDPAAAERLCAALAESPTD